MLQKLLSGALDGTQAFQMWVGDLAIDQLSTMLDKVLTQAPDSELGRILTQVKHRLTTKELSDTDAIESADQGILVPALDGVGNPLFMKFAVGLDHLLGDPGAGFKVVSLGAKLDRLAEVPVDP